ncbi:hypothetical protein SEA_NOSHOW_65 [Mycobacterium phage NoShow]|nr:hypothetical protein SEA_NOSHOW_65 [Mycobacterium phage NoShow]
MSNPFQPNLKLEALHATVELERARLASGEDSSDNEELIKDMEAIHKWLKGDDVEP